MDATELARFRETVSFEPADGCWLWCGTLARGYGRFRSRGQQRYAHRVAYEHYRGEIPEGLDLDHLCRTPRCVNPWHLEPVTRGENIRRGIGVGRSAGSAAARATGNAIAQSLQRAKTHCPAGHPYDEANTRHRLGRRHCRACARDRARAARRAQSPSPVS